MTAVLTHAVPSGVGAAPPGRDLRRWLFPAGVAVLLWALLRIGGLDSSESARIVLVLAVQVATGAVLWCLARGPVPTYATELLGMGAALGTLLSLVGAQLLRPTPLSAAGWLVPTALTGAALALPAARRRIRAGTRLRPGLPEAGVLGLGIGTGLVFVWRFWRAHPLSPTGWWAYHVDIPYHEALATSLATWGPGDSILVAGEPIRYHWFAHAWAGATTDATAAGSFVVVTRVLPLVALVGTVALVWAWSRGMSDNPVVPPLAVLLTTVGMNVASLLRVNFEQMLAVSPSLGLGALWLLGGALVFTEHLRRRLVGGLLLLALLAVGCVGGKTSNAVALLGGVGLVAVLAFSRSGLRSRSWAALGVSLLAVAGAFVVLIMGSTGDVSVELGASARSFGFLPGPGLVAAGIGTVGVALALAAKWAGVLPLLADRRTAARPEVLFALGAAAPGLLLMSVLGHPGASQLYFPVSSGLLVTVVSAWGLGESLGRLPRGALLTAAGAGVLAGTVGSADVPDRLAWAAPYAVWLPLLVLAVVLAAAVLRRHPGAPRGGALVVCAAVLAWGLASASLTTGWTSAWDSVRAGGPRPPAPDAPHAWTPSHVEALTWLRENSEQDDVVATNRQCSRPQLTDECRPDRWFLTAALGQRRLYVEGADYAAGVPHPTWVDERAALSRRFVDRPTTRDARELWDAGVRWIVVDAASTSASTSASTWEPFARRVHTNDVTVVLRLVRP